MHSVETMSSKIFFEFTVLALLLIISCTQGYKVNITHFGNCEDVDDVKVNLTSVQYDYDDEGLCDTIHGKYYVHTRDTGLNYELWMTIFQCSTATSGQCNENSKNYVEPLHCDRFHGDTSGPWYMLAKAMKGSRCGEQVGEFELVSAKLLPEYFDNYLVADPNLPRLRAQMLFHKIGESGNSKHPRGCVNMEFNLIF